MSSPTVGLPKTFNLLSRHFNILEYKSRHINGEIVPINVQLNGDG